MKILLTGSSGFLGKIIQKHFAGDLLITLGRSGNCSIQSDLAKSVPSLPKVDLVIHVAGKAHSVPKSESEKQEFFEVNVKGTKNLLDGFSNADSCPTSFIFVSSVAVYGVDHGNNINEDTPLDASDSYGRSKIDAEHIVTEWCKVNSVTCTILRLPLLAGPNPPGNLGAMIKGISKGYYFNINKGRAKKSIVMAEDVARIIERASEIGGVYNLTDGYHPSFYELSNLIALQMNKPKPGNIPMWLANLLAKAGDLLGSKFPINSNKLNKITSDLTFDDNNARTKLGWNPESVLERLNA